MKNSYLLIGLFIFIYSCKRLDIFEKTTFFNKQEWASSDTASFNFTITDTSSRYNIYVVFRHSDAYHFKNLWLNITTIAPGDSTQTFKENLKLADNQQWLGSSMDDIIEHRLRVNDFPVKLNAGNYKFLLQQIMREDPLLNVLNVGIRVEKISL